MQLEAAFSKPDPSYQMSLCQAEEIQINELTTKQQSSTHADFYRRKKEM